MNFAAPWYKASDGTAAVDMQVALVTAWQRAGNKDRPSYDTTWPAGPVGDFALEFTNAPMNPGYADEGVPVPTASYDVAPTQPTGAADRSILAAEARGEFCRETYTPATGQESAGAGHLPTTFMALQPGEND
jgi:hypothetical protein